MMLVPALVPPLVPRAAGTAQGTGQDHEWPLDRERVRVLFIQLGLLDAQVPVAGGSLLVATAPRAAKGVAQDIRPEPHELRLSNQGGRLVLTCRSMPSRLWGETFGSEFAGISYRAVLERAQGERLAVLLAARQRFALPEGWELRLDALDRHVPIRGESEPDRRRSDIDLCAASLAQEFGWRPRPTERRPLEQLPRQRG